MLWVAQLILAVSFLWAAEMKLFSPTEKLALMWPWVAQVPELLVKFTGVADFLAAIGLLLPSLLRIRPELTPVTALGVIVLMGCAIIFHLTRGEASVIGANVAFAVMAAFIAWGRFGKAPIRPK